MTAASEMTDEELIEAFADSLGISEDAAAMLLDTIYSAGDSTAFWFDHENASGSTIPNANLVVTADVGGLQQVQLMLPDIRDEMGSMFDTMLRQMFGDINYLIDFNGKPLGDNYFVYFAYQVNLYGVDMEIYQALTLINGNNYIFTLTVGSNSLMDYIPTFEEMLSTLKPM